MKNIVIIVVTVSIFPNIKHKEHQIYDNIIDLDLPPLKNLKNGIISSSTIAYNILGPPATDWSAAPDVDKTTPTWTKIFEGHATSATNS